MAIREYAVGDPEAVKLWGRKLFQEALKATSFEGLWGEDSDSVIQVLNETNKSPGDRITATLRMIPTGLGVGALTAQEGNEEALVTFTDNLFIEELSHALRARTTGTIGQQRVSFDQRNECMNGLRDWWSDRMDESMFRQLCGYDEAGASILRSGMQLALAPTAGKQLWTETGAATDEDLDSTGDELTLASIDRCIARAKTGTPAIRAAKVKGYPKALYIMFVHPFQTFSLRASAATAGSWFDIQKAAMQGGEISNNPIFTGALGIYNNTLLLENARVTQGLVSTTKVPITTVRRAVFCGAQSAVMAFGQENGPDRVNWVEELFDYGRQLGVSGRMVWGLKKAKFNADDFGTIVVSSYAATP